MQHLPFLATEGALGPWIAGIAAIWIFAAMATKADRWLGLAASAILATTVLLYLSVQHDAVGPSQCSVNATFDCDSVNRSIYSEIGGVPLANIGAAFYGALAALGLFARFRPNSFPSASSWALLFSIAAFATSLLMGGISAVKLGTFCLMCITVYGLSAIALYASGSALRSSGAKFMDGLKAAADASFRTWFTVFAMMLIVLSAARGAATSKIPAPGQVSSGSSGSSAPAAEVQAHAMPNAVDLDGTEPMLGSPSAKVTVVEFADFQCPYCGRISEDIAALPSKHPDMKLLFKNYPISGNCNPFVQGERHTRSCAAAAAGECARQQGRFWELDRLMFKNQTTLEEEDIVFLAKQVNLDLDTFNACRVDPAVQDAIKADVMSADKAGVDGTPSMFVSGVYDGWVQIDNGIEGLAALLTLHEQGAALPPLGNPPRPPE